MSVRITLPLLTILLISGCQTPTQQQPGAVIGGIAGGVLGNQIGHGSGRTAAVIAGTMIGAMAGGAIGAHMDEADRLRTQRVLETTPTYQSSSWSNPDSGAQYTVTPTKTYETSQGPCREYETEAYIDGRRETVIGNACRQADGSWKAVN